MTSESPSRFTITQWLVIIIASIGFLFDTYELLMTPLVGVPAIAELLQVPANNPLVTKWMGNILWLSALCGGVFGLLGGWLIDRFGRKRIMVASILVYSLSPFAAAFSTSLGMFVFFRCLTFIGVCVEFVAAITWLAELFPQKRRKEIVLGSTQAFASLGGLLVTGINAWIITRANTLPTLPLPDIFNGHAAWRYALMTGILPAIPIMVLLPFVPESQTWREKKQAGTLKRPSFGALFAPELRRVTLVTALLSACAYAAAFGALQLTPLRVAPGLPELAEQRKALKPLQDDARKLNTDLLAALPAFHQALSDVPGLEELTVQRGRTRTQIRSAKKTIDNPDADEVQKTTAKAQLATLGAHISQLDTNLTELTQSKPEAKKAVIDREKILKQLGDNRDQQEPFDVAVKKQGNVMQGAQESGGLVGRIILAILLVTAISRRNLLRLFLIPGLIMLPLTYWMFYKHSAVEMQWGIFVCGLLIVAQFSYFGEYLPRVFPLHLRGTGGSFATNVGGRMLGTSAALLTTNIIAPMAGAKSTFDQVAIAAGIVGTAVFAIALVLTFLLPEPKAEPVETTVESKSTVASR
ncbi:MFS transporter [Pedosphaera parvula]|uniref:Major facilitator superfamily MFS_1 n=1 Tax=Pedosphaera parvula (strain Ellin514) TaxID=320771 RepID=B9XQ56_PEDPL|nr:MFS transporter [Pedosphaera parvula]EEF58060.1 major facilitator superfamily MFS_1 [Pedosphaera parvula Ellin514]